MTAIAEETYGQKMRRLRLEVGLTQAELADILGVAKQSITLWETGKRHGVTTEAAALPRRAIELLSARLRRRNKGT